MLGTLAGAALVIVSQHWTDRRARAEAHRQEVKEATGQLLEAVLTYRELYWLWLAGVREGQHEASADRAARYRAHSAITNARDRLALATTHQTLIAAAEEATWSAVELSIWRRRAADACRRQRARCTSGGDRAPPGSRQPGPANRPGQDEEEDLARVLIAAAWFQVLARTSIGFAFAPLAIAALDDPAP
ncbi:hypothetical protein [Streptomyces sp. NPDC088847]|uniref:hypothetical protein n=1 Tax=Streptomyces sp. NPDC088847 TaxID=3365909 RepID=UPI003828641A